MTEIMGKDIEYRVARETEKRDACLKATINHLSNCFNDIGLTLLDFLEGDHSDMTEQTYTVRLDVSALVVIGPDCEDGEELRSIRFVDINDGIGIDISDFEKNGETIKQVLSDRLAESIMAAHRKQNRIER